jgi:hypothetical protein
LQKARSRFPLISKVDIRARQLQLDNLGATQLELLQADAENILEEIQRPKCSPPHLLSHWTELGMFVVEPERNGRACSKPREHKGPPRLCRFGTVADNKEQGLQVEDGRLVQLVQNVAFAFPSPSFPMGCVST